MKRFALILAVATVAACSNPQTPESVASAYVASMLSHDAAAMKDVTLTGSQAERSWAQDSAMFKTLQGEPGQPPISAAAPTCRPSTSTTICRITVSRSAKERLDLTIHISADPSGSLRVAESLR